MRLIHASVSGVLNVINKVKTKSLLILDRQKVLQKEIFEFSHMEIYAHSGSSTLDDITKTNFGVIYNKIGEEEIGKSIKAGKVKRK